MPNWIRTKLHFNVSDEAFDKIVENYCTDGCLDFDKVIPMPLNVYREPLSMEDRRKYPGDLNWYDWSCNHWGTKWNASAGEVNEMDHSLIFSTAWAYAEPVVSELARKTGAVIEAVALNEDFNVGVQWQSLWTDEDGEPVSMSGVYNYGTDEFWEAAEELWGYNRDEYEEEFEDD